MKKFLPRVLFLAVAMFSVTSLGVSGLQCENGFVVANRKRRKGDEMTMIQVCCQDITCGPGEEAVACEEGDPYSSACDPCETGTRQETTTTLATGGGSCTPNVDCNKLFRVTKFAGNSTSNSECGDCFPGYKNSNNQLITKECLVNNCPPGQEPERDGCRWCSVGYFSDKEDNKPCKKRSICECMLMEGNETMDNKCSQDVSLCSTSADAVTVDASTQSSPVKVNEGVTVGLSVVGGVVLIVIIGVVLYVVIKRRDICARMGRNPDATSTVGSNNHRDIENGRQSDDVGPTSGQPAPSENPAVNSSDSLTSNSNIVSDQAPVQVSEQSHDPHPSMTRGQSKQDGYESQPSLADNVDLDSQTTHKHLVSNNSEPASTTRTEVILRNGSMHAVNENTRRNLENRYETTCVGEQPSSTNSEPVPTARTENVEPNGNMLNNKDTSVVRDGQNSENPQNGYRTSTGGGPQPENEDTSVALKSWKVNSGDNYEE
ncbi:uncharacterized protein LOC106153611 isoform X2 [Lingula anatina]|uniref:Uncharacterized protein LOC106153611 isoform X2 n=1 Tax=Lingula anatina TaxID=7574 RepID=A0A1S3HAK3_LINAN|nr:uncharacterized protein LOC106153611 isoform X2 [Lingula anatina]|eukprot:XP_013383062.1 uncharacterized protein LOC106153611 isoform X2 [Lingula anatina]